MKSNENYNLEENKLQPMEQDNESSSINRISQFNLIIEKNNLILYRKKLEKRLFIFWIIISFLSISFYMKYSLSKISQNKSQENEYIEDNIDIMNIPKLNVIEQKPNDSEYSKVKKYMTNANEKVGVAFAFESMYGNGIGRMLSVLFQELAKYEKYDIYLITQNLYSLDFKIDKKVKVYKIFGNHTLIRKFNEETNVKYYVIHNIIDPREINFYKSLGKKVIDINHGTYLSCVYANCTGVYKAWDYQKRFDAFIQVVVDDYYIYKKLDFNNTFYIPNMFTFDADKTPNSNLTYKNLMIMGREHDGLKGGYYGIKAMNEIVKEVPDAKLYFISQITKLIFYVV